MADFLLVPPVSRWRWLWSFAFTAEYAKGCGNAFAPASASHENVGAVVVEGKTPEPMVVS
ncbi:MAG TPA: hypothetical protein VF883_04865 [Thermoanaerobaculia bacterium]|jgi:hypothetical protein